MNIPFLSLHDVTALHGAEINEAVSRVVNGGWYLQGKENEKFEKDFSDFVGAKYTVGCANGLDALIWIFRAYIEMGVMKEGDEVIVPANTYIATILAITENRLVPVLVEPTFDNLEIDIDKIEAAITPKTKGIMIVHLYGRVAYNDKLGEICKKHNLKLMEDCAQSHGCAWKGVKTGALGDAAAHSFYPGKNIGAFGENVYKIGMTRRLEPQDRIDELGDASVPFEFDVHALIFSDDAPKLEAALHHAFEDRKVNMVNTRREFFRVTLDEIKQVVRDNFDKTVEFIDVPAAEQYRETLLIQEKTK